MKTKLEKILEDLNAGNVAQAKKTLAILVANFDSESRKAFASKGGTAGKGKAKTRSPEFYKELAAKGVAARQAKWALVKRTKEDDEEETKMKAEVAKNAP